MNCPLSRMSAFCWPTLGGRVETIRPADLALSASWETSPLSIGTRHGAASPGDAVFEVVEQAL